MSISIAVTCHEPYLKWLEGCIESIDLQRPEYDAKFLVLDGCEPPAWVPEDWIVIRGDWGSCVPGRRLAFEACDTDWIVFCDADTLMRVDSSYLIARDIERTGADVAFIYYPVIFCDEQLRLIEELRYDVPEWDPLELSFSNFVNTCSVWRVAAMSDNSAWRVPHGSYDYILALDLSRRGWNGLKGTGSINIGRDHPTSMSAQEQSNINAFIDRVHGLYVHHYICYVTGEGREDFAGWFATADLPEMRHLTVISEAPLVIPTEGFTSVRTMPPSRDALSEALRTAAGDYITTLTFDGEASIPPANLGRTLYAPFFADVTGPMAGVHLRRRVAAVQLGGGPTDGPAPDGFLEVASTRDENWSVESSVGWHMTMWSNAHLRRVGVRSEGVTEDPLGWGWLLVEDLSSAGLRFNRISTEERRVENR